MPKVKARKRCGGALGFAEISAVSFLPKCRRQFLCAISENPSPHPVAYVGVGDGTTFLAGNHVAIPG